uniref:Serine-threonine/tyrosine-protein kinase catalytic domain-containing protein n=1 Tax=Vombatus ursinus TaxID=29139 RepID=A0A4X2M854_VOMUR
MGMGEPNSCLPIYTYPSPALILVPAEYGYEIGRVIGNGSYGTVYEACYTKQRVHVAVKVISKKKASEDYLTKFLCLCNVWYYTINASLHDWGTLDLELRPESQSCLWCLLAV